MKNPRQYANDTNKIQKTKKSAFYRGFFHL